MQTSFQLKEDCMQILTARAQSGKSIDLDACERLLKANTNLGFVREKAWFDIYCLPAYIDELTVKLEAAFPDLLLTVEEGALDIATVGSTTRVAEIMLHVDIIMVPHPGFVLIVTKPLLQNMISHIQGVDPTDPVSDLPAFSCSGYTSTFEGYLTAAGIAYFPLSL
jgi:hypothetical protein